MRIKGSKRQIFRERNDAVLKYNDLRRSADEVNKVIDAILGTIVRAYGVDGELSIQAPKVTRKKQVKAEKTDDGKLVIRLRSEDETEGSNQEG